MQGTLSAFITLADTRLTPSDVEALAALKRFADGGFWHNALICDQRLEAVLLKAVDGNDERERGMACSMLHVLYKVSAN